MNVVVTGGAGYIGSICVEELLNAGHAVTVFDNLTEGHRAAVDSRARFIFGCLSDRAAILRTLRETHAEGVLHFAANALVGESMTNPTKYFRNNVAYGLNLLDAAVESRVRKFVFSSTCATYGPPERVPMTENLPQRPINPYGESKLMFEKMLEWFRQIHGLEFVAFRYFNAAGASARFGEHHRIETHLIPNVLRVPLGQSSHCEIFGTDYPTPDGTCIRDYIHVQDLAEAHVCALNYLRGGQPSTHVNLGTGTGVSVREIINLAESVTGKTVPVVLGPRREGDPPELVGNPAKAKAVLGWEARYRDPRAMVESAWAWLTGPRKGRYPAN